MTIKYTREFIAQLKKQNVRIRKSFKKTIIQFSKDPNNKELNNHVLRKEWQGHRSINITADFRGIYKETQLRNEKIIHFVTLGTHKQLYKQKKRWGSLN